MALLALLHPDKEFDESPLILDLAAAVKAHDPITPEDAQALSVTIKEEHDQAYDGALFVWAYLRDVHLIRGSVVEMKHPARDVDPVDVTRKGKAK